MVCEANNEHVISEIPKSHPNQKKLRAVHGPGVPARFELQFDG